MDEGIRKTHSFLGKTNQFIQKHNCTRIMKYHFYLGFLLLALACEKTDPAPIDFPMEPMPIDTAYGYPPRLVYNCLGIDTIGLDYPDISGWSKTRIQSNLGIAAYGTIYFVDEMNGFLFRNSGIINKTTDGGQTWIQVHNQINIRFGSAFFSSSEHGVIVCTDNGSNEEIYLLVTYDSGNTWTRSANFTTKFSFVKQIQFVGPDLGYMSERDASFRSNFYKTIDSAKTWTPVLKNNFSSFNGSFRFQSRDTGYYSTSGTRIFRTIDGGQQWVPNVVPVSETTDIQFFNDSLGVLHGFGGVSITQSGGNRWEFVSERPTEFGRFFVDGSAVLFQRIKICNTNTSTKIYAFVTTNDFGATWKVGPLTKTNVESSYFCFINERCIISLGQDGELYKWTRL